MKKSVFVVLLLLVLSLVTITFGCLDDPDKHYNNGIELQEQGQLQEAIEEYDEVIRIDPERADAYHNRGTAYYRLEQYEQAIADYDEVIRLDPERTDAYYNRALAYYKLEQYGQAIADYYQVIRLDPDNADAYRNRGVAYGKLGKFQKAIENYDEAIRLNPEYASAYYNRGIAYDKLGKFQKAIEDYVMLIRETFNSLAYGKIRNIPQIEKEIKKIKSRAEAQRQKARKYYTSRRENLLQKAFPGDKLDRSLAKLDEEVEQQINKISL